MDISNLQALVAGEARTMEQMQRLIEIAGWKDDPRIAGLLRLAVRSGKWDPLLVLLRTRFRNAQEFHPFQDVPSPADVDGDIIIGNLVMPDWTLGCTVGLKPVHLPTHIQIVGPSGKGKSILTKFLALQIHHAGVPVLVADTEETFGDFPLYVPPGEALVFDVAKGEFKRNMWQPLPGETFMDTEARLRDIFREVWVGEGGINILSEIAIDLHDQHGLFTLSQFYERLKRMRSDRKLDWRRGQYLESLINRTSNLVNHLSGTYEAIEGFALDELLTHSNVFRIPRLSSDLIVFFVVELLSAISDMKLRQGTSALPLVAVLDEAQRFLEGNHSGTVIGQPAIFDLVATLRKRSSGLLVATQLVSRLPDVVLGNMATQIYFQTLDGDSISKIGKSLSLSHEQMEFLPEIPARCALMRHPNVAKPFLVRIPDLNLEHIMTEEQLNEIMAPILASLKWKPRPNEPLYDAAPNNKSRSPNKKEPPLLVLDESDYLIDIAKTPWEPATERDKRLKLSGYKGDALRSKLTQRGMVEANKIATGKRGGQVSLLEVMQEGWAYLRSIKSGIEPPPGKGGFLHKYYQHKVQEMLVSAVALDVRIEDASTGKSVDVSAEINGQRVAYEILVTGIEKEKSNIVKDVSGYDRVVMLVSDDRQLEELQEWIDSELDSNLRDKVEVSTIVEFLFQKRMGEQK